MGAAQRMLVQQVNVTLAPLPCTLPPSTPTITKQVMTIKNTPVRLLAPPLHLLQMLPTVFLRSAIAFNALESGHSAHVELDQCVVHRGSSLDGALLCLI